jgi:hypothetical protein
VKKSQGRKRESKKKQSAPPIYLSPPGGTFDWSRIEAAAGLNIPPEIRQSVYDHLMGSWRLYRTDRRPTPAQESKERKLLRKVERRCLAAAEALRDYQTHIQETDSGNAMFGMFDMPSGVDLSSEAAQSRAKACQALTNKEYADSVEAIANYAGRVNDQWPARSPGRPKGDDLRVILDPLYNLFRAAGGRGSSYYADADGKYKGSFGKMVEEILRQMNYPIQSANALGELIDKHFRGLKSLTIEDRTALRNSRMLDEIDRAHRAKTRALR